MNLTLAMIMPTQEAAKIQEIAWDTGACLHNTVDELHDVGQDIADCRLPIVD